MKLSIAMHSLDSYYREGKIDIPRFIEFCEQLGVEGVELVDSYWKNQETEIKVVQKALAERNLDLAAYTIVNDFGHLQKEKKKQQIEYVKKSIDIAAELRSPLIRIFGGKIHKETISKKEVLNLVLDALDPCLSYAAANNVILAIENSATVPGNSWEVKSILKTFNSEFLKATVDTANFLDVGEDPLTGVRSLIPYAAHFHLKDRKKIGKDEEEPGYIDCVLGEGVIDFPQILTEIKKSGYQNFLSIECWAPIDDRKKIERSTVFLRAAWNKITS